MEFVCLEFTVFLYRSASEISKCSQISNTLSGKLFPVIDNWFLEHEQSSLVSDCLNIVQFIRSYYRHYNEILFRFFQVFIKNTLANFTRNSLSSSNSSIRKSSRDSLKNAFIDSSKKYLEITPGIRLSGFSNIYLFSLWNLLLQVMLFPSRISLPCISLHILLKKSSWYAEDIPSETPPGNFYRYSSKNPPWISIGNQTFRDEFLQIFLRHSSEQYLRCSSRNFSWNSLYNNCSEIPQ